MRVAKAVAAWLTIALTVVGVPMVLALVWRLEPQIDWSEDGLRAALSTLGDGRLVLALFRVAAWGVWWLLVFLLVFEAIAAWRHARAPRMTGLGWLQSFARALVGAAVAVFMTT